MRYHVKNAAGEELVCPSLADLHALYRQGFFADDDLVRAESSERWVRAGSMPALHGVRESGAERRRVFALLVAAAALALGIFLLLAHAGRS